MSNDVNKGPVGILGIPLGFGAGQTGSELGVEAMRLSKIRGETLAQHIAALGYAVTDHGNAEIVRPGYAANGQNPKYLPEMLASCENMFASVSAILNAGETPVLLGGDHSV